MPPPFWGLGKGVADSIRGFIAVELPERVRNYIASLILWLQQEGLSDIRWVKPEGVHLTIKFLGTISQETLPDITKVMAQAVREATPFRLKLNGMDVFPNVRVPLVLWLGLADKVKPLTSLQSRLEEGLRPLGFPQEGRPFNPHLTLGRISHSLEPRVKRKLTEILTSAQLDQGIEIPVETLSLIQSTLTPSGALYTHLAEVPLAY